MWMALPHLHVAGATVRVVGPRYGAGADDAGLFRGAVRAALEASREVGARRVALPAISAGIFGYPLAEATSVVVDAALGWLGEHPDALEEVRLVAYAPDVARAFAAALGDHAAS